MDDEEAQLRAEIDIRATELAELRAKLRRLMGAKYVRALRNRRKWDALKAEAVEFAERKGAFGSDE